MTNPIIIATIQQMHSDTRHSVLPQYNYRRVAAGSLATIERLRFVSPSAPTWVEVSESGDLTYVIMLP